jgi:hypothetical protein
MTKVLIYAAILASILGFGAWYGSGRYDAGRDDLLAEQAKQADASRAKEDAKTATSDAGASSAKVEGEQAQADATDRSDVVTRTITRIIHDSPAPTVCVVPPDGVRELAGAIDRANAAARGVSGAQSGRATAADVH